jgi:hypothetical protein
MRRPGRGQPPPGLRCVFPLGCDDPLGHLGHRDVLGRGHGPHLLPGLLRGAAPGVHQNPAGLIEQRPGLDGITQPQHRPLDAVIRDCVAHDRSPERDQQLGERELIRIQRPWPGAEHGQGEGPFPGPLGQRDTAPDTTGERRGREPRPALLLQGVRAADRARANRARADRARAGRGVQAGQGVQPGRRAGRQLQLEQFGEVGMAGRPDHRLGLAPDGRGGARAAPDLP